MKQYYIVRMSKAKCVSIECMKKKLEIETKRKKYKNRELNSAVE